MVDRRSLLRGLVTLPLIGGGVTLIGRPAAAVPLVQAAALPAFDDPRQRARYAWEAFSAALDDLTAGADGWRIRGAGRIAPCGRHEGVEFLNLAEVHMARNSALDPDLIVERHRDFALDLAEDAMIQADNLRKAVARHAQGMQS